MSKSRKDTSDMIECGLIGRAVGLSGEVSVNFRSGDSPVSVGSNLTIMRKGGSDFEMHKVASLRRQGRSYVVRLEGVADRNEAQRLNLSKVYVDKKELKELPDDEYYCHQIIGLDVFDERGANLGKVAKVFTAGENDVYEVHCDKGKGREDILIPARKEFVVSIDLEKKRMTVRLIEGMIE